MQVTRIILDDVLNVRAAVLVGIATLCSGCVASPGVIDPVDVETAGGSPVIVALLDAADQNLDAGRLEQASAAIERALRIAPQDASLWTRLARIRLAQKQFEQAIQLASKSNAMTNDQNLRRQNNRLVGQAHRAMENPNRVHQP